MMTEFFILGELSLWRAGEEIYKKIYIFLNFIYYFARLIHNCKLSGLHWGFSSLVSHDLTVRVAVVITL